MAIRDRITGIGRLAANTLLDRVESGVEALRPGPDPRVDAGDIIDKAFEESRSMSHMGTLDDPGDEHFGGPLEKGDPGASAGSRPAPASERKRGPSAAPPMPPTDLALEDPKALYWDPFALVEQLGYKERPSAVTYGTLQAMVWKVPLVNAIIQTRINQISAFATPQRNRFETGFRVRLRDQEAKPTRQDKIFMKKMEDMLITTGNTEDPRGRDSFETFLRKITRDSLTYDQTCIEVVPGRDGRPAEWYAVDAATVRLADTHRLHPDDNTDRIKTVQIYDQVVISEFTDKELAFGVRNPRSDIRSQGYGTSELEMLISTITHILWGLNYNANFFSQGSVAKGLLNLKGAIPEKQLRAFRRQWYQMVAGVENAWRTPIVNAEEIQWVNMQASNRDMEFSSWIDFLIKIACAVFQMDPIEVNFKYGSTGQRAMFGAADRAKLVESKDKGLKPLLRHFSRLVDKYIIWPINPAFVLEFIGLESQTPKEVADLNTQRVRTIYTIDEIRAENDLSALPDGLGQVILDANWLAARKQAMDAKAAEEAAQQAQAMTAMAGPGLEQQVAPAGVPPGGPVVGERGGAPGAGGKRPAGKQPTAQQQKELEALLRPTAKEKSEQEPMTLRKASPLVIDLTI